jgi:hypothetical protein
MITCADVGRVGHNPISTRRRLFLAIPSKQVCPLCGRDDTVVQLGIRNGKWLFRCTNPKKHFDQVDWASVDATPEEDTREPGVMEEFGLFQDLPHCLNDGEPFVEYGIVEHRYRQLRPDTFKDIVAKYGHRAVEVGRPYTTSSFLASALRILADRDEIELRWGPATGFWAYDGTVGYWALAPASSDQLLSWDEFATKANLDPVGSVEDIRQMMGVGHDDDE